MRAKGCLIGESIRSCVNAAKGNPSGLTGAYFDSGIDLWKDGARHSHKAELGLHYNPDLNRDTASRGRNE
ncbi:MAG TPA: hypothetical protein VEZ90_18590, partial [Blastocatellia bacterium]|nr:hypothetical protein [Blastocatellia bacterium]